VVAAAPAVTRTASVAYGGRCRFEKVSWRAREVLERRAADRTSRAQSAIADDTALLGAMRGMNSIADDGYAACRTPALMTSTAYADRERGST
jgi:hypothetical protein